MMHESIAILDAAVAYGAARWYRGVHSDPAWEFEGKYKPVEDRLHFLEFVHDLVLYNRIVLDRSSVGISISNELLELFEKINARLSRDLITTDRIAPYTSQTGIVQGLSHLLASASLDPERKQLMKSTPVPWAYHTDMHPDRSAFQQATKEWGLDETLIPYAIFAYRGLCYSGFAHHYSQTKSMPAVYLASPGRMQALEPILSSTEIRNLTYPREAYADLVPLLELPTEGFSFSHLPSMPVAHWSDLTQQLDGLPPREALNHALRLRESSEAKTLREQWAERVWTRSQSAAVGRVVQQSVSHSTISGDLIQIVHAQA